MSRDTCRVCRTSQRLDASGRIGEHLALPIPVDHVGVESCGGVGYLPAHLGDDIATAGAALTSIVAAVPPPCST